MSGVLSGMARTLVSDTTTKTTLAAASDIRTELKVVNESTSYLDLYASQAEPFKRLSPGECYSFPAGFSGAVQGKWTADGAGRAVIYESTAANQLSAAAWAAANPVPAAGQICPETDTGVVRVGDGTTAYLNLSAGVRTCKQTAQVTNSVLASPTDVTGMAFSVQANHLYIVEFFLIYQSAVTTTGIGFTASAPALADTDYWTCNIQQGATGTDVMFQQAQATFGAALVSASVVAQDTPYFAHLYGIFTPTADGTVQLKARTEVDGTLVTVLAGGRGRLTDCGV